MARKRKYPNPGNPEIEKYKIQAKVPEKPNLALFALRVPEKLSADIKSTKGWQDRVRAKLEELQLELLQENAIATSTETYPVGGGAGSSASD